MSYTQDDKYANYSPVDICEMIGQQYKRSGNYCVTACYNASGHANGDRKPSMAVYGYERGFYCFSCGQSGTNSWLLKQFGARDDNYAPKVIDRPKATIVDNAVTSSDAYCEKLMALYESLPELPADAVTMLERKGFDPDMFSEIDTLSPNMKWKWHTNQVRGWGEGIFIPYVFEGRMITARLRRLNAAEGTPRFLSMPGNTMWPYNLDAVLRNSTVFVTEGETDCLTMNLMGLPAVGIPGATSGRAITRLIDSAQDYATRLIVVPDNDDAGYAFAERIRLAGFESKVAVDVAKVPFGKDINDWYNEASPAQLQSFLARHTPRIPKPIKRVGGTFVDDLNLNEVKEVESWSQLAIS